MKNKGKFFVLTLVTLLLGVIVGLFFTTVTNASQSHDFHYGKTTSLVGATDSQVSQYALEYVEATFEVKAEPKVILAKSVTNDDLSKMELTPIYVASIEQPPLKLVIIKGNFGLGHVLGGGMMSDAARSNFRIGYIELVFDVWSGIPASTVTSPNGGSFRKALNDPTLPDDYPSSGPLAEKNISSVPIVIQPTARTSHYKDVAPTVAIDSEK